LTNEIAVSPSQITQACSSEPAVPLVPNNAVFRGIEQAIRETETLEVFYHTQSRKVTQWRRMNPLHLVHVDGEWYLLAHCHLHRQVRVFRPARIRECRRTGEHFPAPEGFDAIHFLKAKFHVADDDSPAEVKIRFDHSLVEHVAGGNGRRARKSSS